ncbi:unnamed protein product [Ilex paraguariensis]|uniref:Uncharacterized protein n=1 Tax=Ilex paraguariensis TaxID=185542 RepID=A0ABC8QPR5_9AQUA
MSILASHPCAWSPTVWVHHFKGRYLRVPYFGYSSRDSPSKEPVLFQGQNLLNSCSQSARQYQPVFSGTVDDGMGPDDPEDGVDKDVSSEGETDAVNRDMVRENLERIIGTDDSTFSGIDLATLIRDKYGRSYDVQLIKKYPRSMETSKNATCPCCTDYERLAPATHVDVAEAKMATDGNVSRQEQVKEKELNSAVNILTKLNHERGIEKRVKRTSPKV